MRFQLEQVRYIPAKLEPGVLYVSKEFAIAAHLCACGCGSKIRTPLGPTEWSVRETRKGPTLRPSVGNWQETCQSHYWIQGGEVIWSDKWTLQQIAQGQKCEQDRRVSYFRARAQKQLSLIARNWLRVKEWFRRS
jgi:hypothetical protein